MFIAVQLICLLNIILNNSLSFFFLVFNRVTSIDQIINLGRKIKQFTLCKYEYLNYAILNWNSFTKKLSFKLSFDLDEIDGYLDRRHRRSATFQTRIWWWKRLSPFNQLWKKALCEWNFEKSFFLESQVEAIKLAQVYLMLTSFVMDLNSGNHLNAHQKSLMKSQQMLKGCNRFILFIPSRNWIENR